MGLVKIVFYVEEEKKRVCGISYRWPARFPADWAIFSLHYLSKKCHLAHWIIEAPYFELADLENKQDGEKKRMMVWLYLDIHRKSIEPHGTNESNPSGKCVHYFQVRIYPYSCKIMFYGSFFNKYIWYFINPEWLKRSI